MTEREKLLHDIEAFIARAAMSPTKFGLLAMNDPALMKRLRAGGDVRTLTAHRIRTFIKDWRPPANPKHRASARAA